MKRYTEIVNSRLCVIPSPPSRTRQVRRGRLDGNRGSRVADAVPKEPTRGAKLSKSSLVFRVGRVGAGRGGSDRGRGGSCAHSHQRRRGHGGEGKDGKGEHVWERKSEGARRREASEGKTSVGESVETREMND